jgi:hypothetical protein
MKKVIIPALALFVFSAAASAQQKEPQKGVSTASSKTVVHKPAVKTASVTPAKTSTPATVTKTTTATKHAAIKRKHHHKPKKAKAKKM